MAEDYFGLVATKYDELAENTVRNSLLTVWRC